MQEYTRKLAVKRWEKQENGLRGWSQVPAKVDVSIDWDGIFQLLGDKALSNKSGKTRMLGGLIKAEAWRIKG